MPDYAIPHLALYTYTADERTRRLALCSRFVPGEVSQELEDALFWVEEEDELGDQGIVVNPRGGEVEEDLRDRQVRVSLARAARKRRQYPWFEWMLKWGYPPGWVAGKGELAFLRLGSKAD